MNGGVRSKALGQGTKWVGFDKVTQYPIKSQTIKQRVDLATADGKKTDVKINYTYHIDASKAVGVYKKFGNVDIQSIEKGWLSQQLTSSGRMVLSKHTLLEVVGTDSSEVQAKLLKEFRNHTDSQGFAIESLSFGTPSLDSQTQKSIDDIIKAGQDNKKAELEAKTKQTKADANAKAKLTQAQADAKANSLVSKSIDENIIKNKIAEAHLKHGFVTTNAGSVIKGN